MIVRERLLAQMSTLVSQSRWEQGLNEIIGQMLQIKPLNVYLYLQRKMSLRQRLDNNKGSQYLLEMTMYLSYLDPLTTSEQTIRDKIISLCVEKYQHTKIKKTQISQIVTVVLQNFQTQKKELFLKLMEQMLDHQIYTILEYAELLYHSLIFRAILEEIERLELKLKQIGIIIDRSILLQYINTVNQQTSILKKTGLELEGDPNIYKMVATQIAARISI